MAEPKRGSKEAFLESEKRRKDRVKSKAKGFNIFKLSENPPNPVLHL